jgi:hypothetical protein
MLRVRLVGWMGSETKRGREFRKTPRIGFLFLEELIKLVSRDGQN